MPATYRDLPAYKDLKPVPGMPHGCAWGLFGKEGEESKDELGTLNFLTPDVVATAGKELQTGERVQLDLPLDTFEYLVSKRQTFEQKILDLRSIGHIACDDIHFNTQGNSQWDGLRHFAHQATQKYYNGLTHEEIMNGTAGLRLGTQNICDAGGIVGRGVLLDWAAWNERRGGVIDYSSGHAIPVKELDEVANAQGTELRFGDILIVRNGWLKWYLDQKDPASRKRNMVENQVFVGVKADYDTVEWLWNHHFSAVAGDAIGFESWPQKGEVSLHEHFLSYWGTPLGELWDLEKLSAICAKHQRWSFLLTSAPLRVPGGVGTPPNAVAIF